MKLISIEEEPFFSQVYLLASSRGGTDSATLPFLRGTVDSLPSTLEGLLIAADLQGMAPSAAGEAVLLGRAVIETYNALADERTVPDAQDVGVILAGDLYSDPLAKKRGATGEVTRVWTDFADQFAFVAGVAGNHDTFDDRDWLEQYPGVSLLDGQIEEICGLSIGGVGGVIGRPTKNERKNVGRFIRAIDEVLAAEPDLFVLHEGPNDEVNRYPGNPVVRRSLEDRKVLTVFGHRPWKTPWIAPFLNVHERVVLLERTARADADAP